MLPSQRSGWRVDRGHSILNGCVGWWPLWDVAGSQAVDLLGRYSMTLNGTFNHVDELVGKGINKTATSADYFESQNNPTELSVDVIDGFSVVTWVKPSDLSGGDTFSASNPRFIVVKANDGIIAETNYWLRLLGGKIDFGYRNAADTAYVGKRSDSAVVIENQSQMVAAVHTGSDVRLYLNGVEISSSVSSGTITDSSYQNTGPLRLGQQSTTGNIRGFDGALFQTRIFKRALSDSEIKQLYEQPWLGLEPIVPATFYTAGAAPSSFQPAWAHMATRITL